MQQRVAPACHQLEKVLKKSKEDSVEPKINKHINKKEKAALKLSTGNIESASEEDPGPMTSIT